MEDYLTLYLGCTPFKGNRLRVILPVALDRGDNMENPPIFQIPGDCPVTSELDLTPKEDPDTPDRWQQLFVGNMGLITKVMASSDDRVRAIFVNKSEIPFAIVTPDGCADFNELDPGMTVERKMVSDKTKNSLTTLSRAEHWSDGMAISNQFPAPGVTPEGELEKLRKNMLDDYLSGKSDKLPCGLFLAEDRDLKYSGTVIRFESRAALVAVCGGKLSKTVRIKRRYGRGYLATVQSNVLEADMEIGDLNPTVGRIAKAAGKHGGVTINGVPVLYVQSESSSGGELHYINKHRISAPDLTYALEHALCFPDDWKGYERFLKSVTTVSLKFFRAMEDGIPLNLQLSDFKYLGKDKDSLIPGGHESGDASTLTITLPFEKTSNSKSRVMLLGQWRRVDSFDTFCNLARRNTHNTIRNSAGYFHDTTRTRGAYYSDSSKNYTPCGVFRQIYGMNCYLHPEDRVPIPAGVVQKHIDGGVYVGLGAGRVCREAEQMLEAQLGQAFQAELAREAEKIARSKELLDEVMTQTGAARCTTSKGSAFRVTGLSGTTYSIDEKTAAVTGPDGGHICIIATTRDKSGYDYIAALMVALSKDSLTAKSISTLQKYVGKKAIASDREADGPEQVFEDARAEE